MTEKQKLLMQQASIEAKQVEITIQIATVYNTSAEERLEDQYRALEEKRKEIIEKIKTL